MFPQQDRGIVDLFPAMIRLVKSSKGAIGFVSKDAAAGEGVKVVLTLSY